MDRQMLKQLASWLDPYRVTDGSKFRLARIDPAFAKDQLNLFLREWYMHPNGQIPAYEWNFDDINPPVHAWAAIRVFEIEGGTDVGFLTRVFHKLLLNFTWWVNRKDVNGRNVFQGGFLGLDNIGVFDRSAPLPTGGTLEQADGTAWMVLFCQNMVEIGAELAKNIDVEMTDEHWAVIRFLRDLADARVLRDRDIAAFGGQIARDDADQRRRARTVLADEPGLGAGRQRNTGMVDEQTAGDAGGDVVDGDHGSGFWPMSRPKASGRGCPVGPVRRSRQATWRCPGL